MGHTIQKLSHKEIKDKPIFDNRFVIEICERVHFHYRNIRITQTLDDFINMAEGIKDAVDRWKKRGCPGTGNVHIELCRKKVAIVDENNSFQVNLNDNLYKKNEGSIFSEGANFNDDKYIHLKLRDIRVELSLNEWKELSNAVIEANQRLEDSHLHESLQKT